jgi:DNA polymerase I-like protein with 3'-5' exonuclease and polymerase domains
MRGLIKPRPGYALAYLDWSAQEVGIGAALSGDPEMIAAYTSGDLYLTLAKRAGAVPPDGTKKTQGSVRDLYKTVCLGIFYGMGAKALAVKTGQTIEGSRHLIQLHKDIFRVFHRWNGGAVDRVMAKGSIHTVYGWTVQLGLDPNPRSYLNFPIQGNGAEMMRLACCLATENGVSVVAPVHDALMIEAPIDIINQQIAKTEDAMRKASSYVLSGFELRNDRKIVTSPERYMDPRGQIMWNTVMDIVNGDDNLEGGESTYAH